MRTKIKCFISILLSLVVITSFATSVFAVEPRYSDTNSITVKLVISGTTAYCDVKIYGADDTESITDVNIYLKDSKNNTVSKWENLSTTGKIFSFYNTVTNLEKGETYTLYVTAKINRKGGVDTVSESSSQPCPKK